MSDLVENPEDRFSHNEAHISAAVALEFHQHMSSSKHLKQEHFPLMNISLLLTWNVIWPSTSRERLPTLPDFINDVIGHLYRHPSSSLCAFR